MKIEHFLITRFCIRNPEALERVSGAGFRSAQNPLDPDFLEARLKLLEILSSAAVLGQSNLDFSWVIVIDPALGRAYRDRLRHLCGNKVRVIIHEYDSSERLDSTPWLDRYMDGRPDFLITTHLDDDDAFGSTYIEALHRATRAFIQSETTPLVRIFGCKRIWLWNMVHTRSAPLGTRSDYWSSSVKVAACGFALMCKYPEVPLSILAIRHRRAENYLDLSSEPADRKVADFRNRLDHIFSSNGIRLHEHTSRLAFQDLSDRTGHVVMANHSRNDQAHRILKEQVRPVKVTGPETFPNHTVNWEAARRYLPEFRLPYRTRVKIQVRKLRTMVRDTFK